MIFLKNESIWIQNIDSNSFPSLNQDIETDILIIGGGIAGASVLYELKNCKQKLCLIDANQIGFGVTSKSTAKISYLQGIVYSKIESEVGKSYAEAYYKSQRDAIQRIKEIILKEHIDCNFEEVSSYLYETKEHENSLRKEYDFLYQQKAPIRFYQNCIEAKDNYVFHPLKYVNSLIQICSKQKNVQIYENTKALNIEFMNDKIICKGTSFSIATKKIVLTCHYPFFLFPFFLPIKSSIERSYCFAKKTDWNSKKTMLTTYPSIFSKRFYQNQDEIYEIGLGKSHKMCNRLNFKKNFEELISHEKVDFIWSNEDIMTPDYMPYIGVLKENIFLATGFNTWGMTNGALSGILLKDLILNNENEYIPYFSPKRSFNLAKLKGMPSSLFLNLKGMVQNKIWKEKSWYPDSLTFLKKDGVSLALYKDDKEHIVSTTCPHMGCSLIFNEVEKTWDCPCHASRFTIDGKWIKGPSKRNIDIL